MLVKSFITKMPDSPTSFKRPPVASLATLSLAVPESSEASLTWAAGRAFSFLARGRGCATPPSTRLHPRSSSADSSSRVVANPRIQFLLRHSHRSRARNTHHRQDACQHPAKRQRSADAQQGGHFAT